MSKTIPAQVVSIGSGPACYHAQHYAARAMLEQILTPVLTARRHPRVPAAPPLDASSRPRRGGSAWRFRAAASPGRMWVKGGGSGGSALWAMPLPWLPAGKSSRACLAIPIAPPHRAMVSTGTGAQRWTQSFPWNFSPGLLPLMRAGGDKKRYAGT